MTWFSDRWSYLAKIILLVYGRKKFFYVALNIFLFFWRREFRVDKLIIDKYRTVKIIPRTKDSFPIAPHLINVPSVDISVDQQKLVKNPTDRQIVNGSFTHTIVYFRLTYIPHTFHFSFHSWSPISRTLRIRIACPAAVTFLSNLELIHFFE